jgi:iron(III) transport system ATP-binding protein
MNFISDCRTKGPDSIMLGKYFIKTEPGAAADFQDSAVRMGVRPEDIRIIRNGKEKLENIINTKINDIEFRGSLYRIYLQVLHQNGRIGDQTIAMDLQAEAVEEMGLGENMELPIHIPPNKLLIFRENAA